MTYTKSHLPEGLEASGARASFNWERKPSWLPVSAGSDSSLFPLTGKATKVPAEQGRGPPPHRSHFLQCPDIGLKGQHHQWPPVLGRVCPLAFTRRDSTVAGELKARSLALPSAFRLRHTGQKLHGTKWPKQGVLTPGIRVLAGSETEVTAQAHEHLLTVVQQPAIACSRACAVMPACPTRAARAPTGKPGGKNEEASSKAFRVLPPVGHWLQLRHRALCHWGPARRLRLVGVGVSVCGLAALISRAVA